MTRRRPHPFEEERVAELYDAFPFTADVPMYTRLLAETGSKVLELGCGTGRLLVPLAEAGAEIVGVDASPAMLARARAKVEGALPEVRSRIDVTSGDMRDFRLDAKFDLAIVAVKSFGYLTTRGDQQAALARLRDHVRPGGTVVLDLLNPSPEWLSIPEGAVRQDLSKDQSDGSTVMRTETAVSTDWVAQVRMTRSAYEVISPAGDVVKTIVEWPMRYMFRAEAELLLESCGFDVVAVWGDYGGSAYEASSPALILVARRR